MRIGIEGLPLLFHRTGTSTYTHELVQHLRRLGHGDTVTLFARNQGSGGSYHHLSYANRVANLIYKEHRLPEELEQRQIDVYHAPRDMGLPQVSSLPCPAVMTLHDIILVRLAGNYYSPARARLYERRLLEKVKTADHIITVSHFSREDILEWSGIAEDKVSVVYNGVSPQFQPIEDEERLEEVRAKYQLPRRFLLCVGSTEPRKNVRTAIEAFAQLRRVEPGLSLVIFGVDYCRVKPEEAFAGLDLSGVHFAGYVADQDMPTLFSLAQLLLFPSLYEGFGLPPLEAMACGTPVITANLTSVPEIVADAAILVDPRSAGELAAAMELVLSSPQLARQLTEKGLRRAAEFSWQRTAAETRQIYGKIVSG